MNKHLWVIHDLINGVALEKFWTLEEARQAVTDGDLIYRYEVKGKKAVNPVREEA